MPPGECEKASHDMAGPGKSLQVTFGAFSCTLEGFENPVDAVLAVVEHFRAAVARGAAPEAAWGLPDERALARIAEQARSGPVEGRMDGDVLLLRAAPPSGESPAPDSAAPRRRKLPAPPPDDEGVVDRILSQANIHLADPEGARRREAIASLKAAVAATQAGRVLGDSVPDEEERQDAFRDDLRQAVQGRPGSAAEPEGRPAPPQRPGGPQRADGSGPSEPPSFAAFAAEVGAGSLPELLDAAAAWVAVADSADGASRPQLLALAASLLPAPPGRDEGLSCFEALLGQGRLERAEGGRFRPGPESRFHAGRRPG